MAKSTAGLVLTIVGGVLILLTSLVVAAVGGLAEFAGAEKAAETAYAMAGGAFISGILVCVFGYLGYSRYPKAGGILAIVFAFVGLICTGFIALIWFILALIGGILIAVSKPTES